MKCPKCGYVSFNYLDECKKCGKDLEPFKTKNKLWGIEPGELDIFISHGTAVLAGPGKKGEEEWKPSEEVRDFGLGSKSLIDEEVPEIDFDLDDLGFEEGDDLAEGKEEEEVDLLELVSDDSDEEVNLLGEIELSWDEEEEDGLDEEKSV